VIPPSAASVALGWLVGILVVAYAFAIAAYRRKIS
jgi:hypothetical protein